MQTWLDSYVNRYHLRAQALLSRLADDYPFLGQCERELRAATDDNPRAIRLMAQLDVDLASGLRSRQAETTAGVGSQMFWNSVVARFILATQPVPRAMLLDREIVGALSGAAISGDIRKRGHAEAVQHGLTYLDMPHQTLSIGDGVQLRCLFVLADPLGG